MLTHVIKDNTLLVARGTWTKCNSVKEKNISKKYLYDCSRKWGYM